MAGTKTEPMSPEQAKRQAAHRSQFDKSGCLDQATSL